MNVPIKFTKVQKEALYYEMEGGLDDEGWGHPDEMQKALADPVSFTSLWTAIDKNRPLSYQQLAYLNQVVIDSLADTAGSNIRDDFDVTFFRGMLRAAKGMKEKIADAIELATAKRFKSRQRGFEGLRGLSAVKPRLPKLTKKTSGEGTQNSPFTVTWSLGRRFLKFFVLREDHRPDEGYIYWRVELWGGGEFMDTTPMKAFREVVYGDQYGGGYQRDHPDSFAAYRPVFDAIERDIKDIFS